MTDIKKDIHFLELALEQAQKALHYNEVPVGAIIVDKDSNVIAQAHNLKETHKQSTFHAEIKAIEAASIAMKDWRLTGCTLYSTLEPCIMCAGAIVHSRLDRVVYGAKDLKWGGAETLTNIFDLPTNHKIISEYIEHNACGLILKNFFKKKRLDEIYKNSVR